MCIRPDRTRDPSRNPDVRYLPKNLALYNTSRRIRLLALVLLKDDYNLSTLALTPTRLSQAYRRLSLRPSTLPNHRTLQDHRINHLIAISATVVLQLLHPPCHLPINRHRPLYLDP